VVSRTLQAYYHERYGLDPTYIPNGTSLRQPGTISHLPAWGLDLSSYVLFLGRFSPEKNCDLLIDAYEKIDTPVKLVLAGGASHSSAYVEKLRRHESDRIRFLDWVSGEALDELITNAMLFVLPSDLEGLSLALLDAMGAGVCVLASDVPENREVLDGVGFCFRRGDARDLERMLRYLISATPERQAAGERARQRIRENYLWDDVAREVEQFYRQLAGRKPPAGITPFLSSKPRPRSDRAA
jgi:glycosyltransferase involved in cell wall biosynthesis